MSEDRLDVDDLGDSVAYVDVLDATEYYTGRPILSTRHGVRDNLLGCRGFCPVVRRTPLLAKYASQNYGQMALELLNKHGRVLARDYSYDMVLQETIHSMTIEGAAAISEPFVGSMGFQEYQSWMGERGGGTPRGGGGGRDPHVPICPRLSPSHLPRVPVFSQKCCPVHPTLKRLMSSPDTKAFAPPPSLSSRTLLLNPVVPVSP